MYGGQPTTTLDQFANSIRNPVARQQLGFTFSDAEAEWIVTHGPVLQSMYDAWLSGKPVPSPPAAPSVTSAPSAPTGPYRAEQSPYGRPPIAAYPPAPAGGAPAQAQPVYLVPAPQPMYAGPQYSRPASDPAPYVGNLLVAVRSVFSKFADFTGRAGRPEYWWWVLFTFAVALNAVVIDAAIDAPAFTTATWLILLLPSLAVTVRRLRDAGFGWGWIFISLAPFGGIALLVMTLQGPYEERQASQSWAG
ncbi:DUF805 domain-containing protein [Agromyces humi]|uniref:DUF805 domain-containing protein n=1 Tax=Agromyces humi TaxID=1766800 RepID=UPI001359DC66|nr:DUF805 domain-containing protein [Agromyces humi]